VTVNTTASKTVTISNTGSAPLNITNITKAGSAAFSFSPATFPSIAAGANVTLTVTYTPTIAGADTGSTINITSNGGNATVSLTGSAVQQPTTGTGDVALVKLNVPSKITAKVGKVLNIHVLAGATTTAKQAKATATLAASAGGVTVTIDHPSTTEELKSGETRRLMIFAKTRETGGSKTLEFEAKISCTQTGIWPITWTAQISADENSNPANDTLTGTTQVVCSGTTTEKSNGWPSVYQYRIR
jgi:hypothetical protein